MSDEIVLYRAKELTKMLKRSKTQLYDDIRAGQFPAGFLLGKRTRVWSKKEIEEWLAAKAAA